MMIEITEQEFNLIAEYVRTRYGINLRKKKELVKNRLSNILIERQLTSYEEYFRLVQSDRTSHEEEVLLDQLTTNYTYFFRERTHFDFMQEHALPWLYDNVPSKDLRIWSAGCATGEEAYSIVMQLDTFFSEKMCRWDTRVLATDISGKALAKAKEGRYHEASMRELEPAEVHHCFERLGPNDYKIRDWIRKEVIFKRFNLSEAHFSFKKRFHIIFCRNVMIYFDEGVKNRLIERFYEMTEPGGFLFIGHSESLQRDTSPYQYIKPAIFRKI